MTGMYIGIRRNEIFVGNIAVNHRGLHERLGSLKTARVGEVALDLNGKKIPTNYIRPLFINRSESAAYNNIMMTHSHGKGWNLRYKA